MVGAKENAKQGERNGGGGGCCHFIQDGGRRPLGKGSLEVRPDTREGASPECQGEGTQVQRPWGETMTDMFGEQQGSQ